MDPLIRIAGDDWIFGVLFQDGSGGATCIPDTAIPFVELYVGGVNATYGQDDGVTIDLPNRAAGLGIVVVPRRISEGTAPLDPSAWAANNYPIRLRGGFTDALQRRQTYFAEPVIVVDWRTVDIEALPPQRAIIAVTGPAGPTGDASAGTSVADLIPYIFNAAERFGGN